jgi:hypothetical protein
VYEYIAIGRMQAGWHGADLAGGSGSGGRLESYVQHAIDGAVVYDASGADYGACARLVINGPMFKPTLYGVQRFSHHAAAEAMLPALEDGFHTLTARALAGVGLASYGSFDYVGWAEYRQLLETQLGAGVRFGRVVRSGALAATVRWEDGTEQGWCFL